MQNKFRTKLIYKQNNISISNGSLCQLPSSHIVHIVRLLHDYAQQTNIQNLKAWCSNHSVV